MTENRGAVTRSRESRLHERPCSSADRGTREGVQSSGMLSRRTSVRIGPGAPIFKDGARGVISAARPQPDVPVRAGREEAGSLTAV